MGPEREEGVPEGLGEGHSTLRHLQGSVCSRKVILEDGVNPPHEGASGVFWGLGSWGPPSQSLPLTDA